jgi:hypothetical protein
MKTIAIVVGLVFICFFSGPMIFNGLRHLIIFGFSGEVFYYFIRGLIYSIIVILFVLGVVFKTKKC